jgi:phage baseplate assembly protein W
MSDLDMSWAGDISVSATGDLLAVSGPALGTERVLRRLLTNPGDYIWHPEYGAGLGRFVGQPTDAAGIRALILEQMRLEPAVADDPEPVVLVQSDAGGMLSVEIRYADAQTAEAKALTINLPGQ